MEVGKPTSPMVYRFNPQDDTIVMSSPESIVVQPKSQVQQALHAVQSVVPKKTTLKSKRKCIIAVVAAIFVALLGVGIVLVVAYEPLAEHLNKDAVSLETEFENFQAKYKTDSEALRSELLAEFAGEMEDLTVSLGIITDQVDSLARQVSLISDNLETVSDNQIMLSVVNQANRNKLIYLNKKVNVITHNGTVSVEHFKMIQSAVEDLRTSKTVDISHYNSLQALVNGINTAQNSAKTQLENLSRRLNTPANIYQSCFEESRSCTLSSSYWTITRYCSTSSIAANHTGYYTVDTRCEYQSSYSGYQDPAVLYQSLDNVYCKCGVNNPYARNHDPSYSYSGKCILKIKRCKGTLQY